MRLHQCSPCPIVLSPDVRCWHLADVQTALMDVRFQGKEVCILDWYACGRTREGPNVVAGAKCGPHRFKSDAVAGTYDENLGHDCPHSYLFSDQY